MNVSFYGLNKNLSHVKAGFSSLTKHAFFMVLLSFRVFLNTCTNKCTANYQILSGNTGSRVEQSFENKESSNIIVCFIHYNCLPTVSRKSPLIRTLINYYSRKTLKEQTKSFFQSFVEIALLLV